MVFGPPFPLHPHICRVAVLSTGVEASRDFTASHTYGGRFFPAQPRTAGSPDVPLTWTDVRVLPFHLRLLTAAVIRASPLCRASHEPTKARSTLGLIVSVCADLRCQPEQR